MLAVVRLSMGVAVALGMAEAVGRLLLLLLLRLHLHLVGTSRLGRRLQLGQQDGGGAGGCCSSGRGCRHSGQQRLLLRVAAGTGCLLLHHGLQGRGRLLCSLRGVQHRGLHRRAEALLLVGSMAAVAVMAVVAVAGGVAVLRLRFQRLAPVGLLQHKVRGEEGVQAAGVEGAARAAGGVQAGERG